MSEKNQNDIRLLEARLARVEMQLGRVKTGLWVFGVVLVCVGLMFTPLFVVVVYAVAILGIVAAVLAFMYGVMWVLERWFGGAAEGEPAEEDA